MAKGSSPSNKKSGEAYYQGFTKDKLVERILANNIKIIELEDDLEKERKKIASLEKEKLALKKKMDVYNTKEEIVKKILEYRARNYATTIIVDKLRYNGIDSDLQTVKNILECELTPELELYFAKCKASYIEKIKIDTTYYKQASIEEIQRLIDSAYEDLKNADEEDLKQRSGLREQINKLISTRDSLMKNIDEVADKSEEDTLAEDKLKDWENLTNQAKVVDITPFIRQG